MVGLCRLCASLKKSDQLINIKDHTDEICEKLQKCCDICIDANDTMPRAVCCSCSDKLNDAYNFYNRVQEAQETLKFLYPSKHTHENDTLENETLKAVVRNTPAESQVMESAAKEDDTKKKPIKSELKPSIKIESNVEIVKASMNIVDKNLCQGENIQLPETQTKNKLKRLNDKSILVSDAIHQEIHSKCPKKKSPRKLRDVKVEELPNFINTAGQRDETNNDDSGGYLQEVYQILGMSEDDIDHTIVIEKNDIENHFELVTYSESGQEEVVTTEIESVTLEPQGEQVIFQDKEKETVAEVENYAYNDSDDIVLDDRYEQEEIEYLYEEGMEEITETDKVEHKILNSWKDYKYICAYCNYECYSCDGLLKHAVFKHSMDDINKMLFKCIDCQRTFEHYNEFLNHVRFKHHPGLKLRCDACDLLCKTNQQYEMHHDYKCKKTKSLPKNLTCSCCCKAFRTFSGKQVHLKHQLIEESSRIKYHCNQCSDVFLSQAKLKLHIKYHKKQIETMSCDICDKFFLGKDALDAHISTHLETKLHECKLCKKNFKTMECLEKHQNRHIKESEKRFHCSFCTRQFRSRMEQSTHERVHTGEMPLQCNLCEKRFRFRSALAAHLKTHSGVRLYQCDFCAREFNDISNFKKHLRRKHSDAANNTAMKKESLKGS